MSGALRANGLGYRGPSKRSRHAQLKVPSAAQAHFNSEFDCEIFRLELTLGSIDLGFRETRP